ncbi:MAG: hypothetical protein JNL82_30045 [Myxococcales bacterium]|nr:hypothetical protein [Myxococcales bacterium]
MIARPAPLATLLTLAVACGDSGAGDTGAGTGTASTGDAPATSTTGTAGTGDAPTTGTTTGDEPAPTTTDDPGESTAATTGPAEPLCPDVAPPATSGLLFDGDGRVHMGLAPDLGLDHFTLEAWVRRDGRGRTANTGVGGLKIVPIIAKGRGESDGSNVDCNYTFGFHGDVLAADFEDMESGANHPVHGKTAVTWGVWHHVAATYDGAAWRLYLDGALDGEADTAGAVPRHDTIQHFGLGAAYDSEGTPAGGFVGAIDEVRVYSKALGEPEIQATMTSTAPEPLGLVGHWRLDLADDDVRDTAGEAPGTLDGATFTTPGAYLERGLPPTLSNPTATLTTGDIHSLGVDVADLEGDPVEVEFFARELTPADDFTLVVLPDTQYYTRSANPPSHPEPDDPSYFKAQTQWAMDHRDSDHVVGLFGLGDIINNSDQMPQWERASDAISILEDVSDPMWPDGLPFALPYGNHDQLPKDEPEATDVANDYFGVERFGDRIYYGNNYNGDNDENYTYFNSGDLEIVLVSFQYNESPDPDVLTWSRKVFESHPRALGIVATHYIVTGGGNFSSQGEAIYEALKATDNVQLMASGHVAQDARRSDTFEGNTIHSMLSDYQRSAPDPDDPQKPQVVDQGLTNGGHGYMRIWYFQPSLQRLHVESYSPKNDAHYTDANNQFDLDVDLVGAGRSPFTSLGVVPAAAGAAHIDLPVAPGKVYEWYAVARDCEQSRHLPLQLLDRHTR